MLRFLEVAENVEPVVLLAEDGPLVGALEDTGARVEIMPLPARTRNLRRSDVRLGVSLMRVAGDMAQYAARLRRRFVELKPDVVSLISLKSGLYGAPAARLAGIPTVWHLHDQIAPYYLAPRTVAPMRVAIGTLPSAVVAASQATLQTVTWFRPGMRTAVIPGPIPMAPRPVTIRPRVERIGILGRLAPWKGQDVFLRAFADAFPDSSVRAVLIGDAMFGEDAYALDLRRLASELGIADRVDFLGFRRDTEAELRQLDVLVHASVTPDPLGTVVFEGLAVGLPVIAARAGGPGEYIADGAQGLLHTPGDVLELSELLKRTAGDLDLRVRLGAAARARIRDFAPETIAAAWLDLYRDVIGKETRAAPPVSAG